MPPNPHQPPAEVTAADLGRLHRAFDRTKHLLPEHPRLLVPLLLNSEADRLDQTPALKDRFSVAAQRHRPAWLQQLNQPPAYRSQHLRVIPHDGPIRDIATALHLGEWYVASACGRQVRLWKLQTSSPAHERMMEHESFVKSLALVSYQAPGWSGPQLLLAAGSGNTVCIWDALQPGRTPERVMTGHRKWVRSVSLAKFKDRLYVASGSDDATVRVWDALTGEQVQIHEAKLAHKTIVGKERPWPIDYCVTSVSLAAFEDQLHLAYRVDELLLVVDALASEGTSKHVDGGLNKSDKSVLLTAFEDRLCVIAYWNCFVLGYDAMTPEAALESRWDHLAGGNYLSSTVFAGRLFLATNVPHHAVEVWEQALARRSAPFTVLWGHTGRVTSISLVKCDEELYVVSGSEDCTVRVWGVCDEQDSERIIGRVLDENYFEVLSEPKSVSLAQLDGRLHVAAGDLLDGTVRVWEDSGCGVALLQQVGKVNFEPVTSVSLSSFAGRIYIASASGSQPVRVWDAIPRSGSSNYATLTMPFRRLWATLMHKRAPTPIPKKHQGWVNSVALAEFEKGLYLASSSDENIVKIWDALVSDGEPKQLFQVPATSISLAVFSGRLCLATGGYDGTVRIWDALAGEALGEPLTHTRVPTRVQLLTLDSGRLPVLLTTDADHWVQLWHLGTLRRLCRFPLETEPLAFAVHNVKGREELTIAVRAHLRQAFVILRFAVRNLPGAGALAGH